jgi:hypothetical protein
MTHIASMERKEGMIMLEVFPSQLMPNSPLIDVTQTKAVVTIGSYHRG